MEIFESDSIRKRILDDFGRSEMEKGRAVRAFGGVETWILDSAVGRVGPLTKVHDMHSVEVGQIEGLGDIRGNIVDKVIDAFLQVVDEIIEEPSIPIRGVE